MNDDRRQRVRVAFEEYQRSRVLTNLLTLEAILGRSYWEDREPRRGATPHLTEAECREIGDATDRIHAATKVFEGARWFWGGLQEKVNGTDERYLSGSGDGWSMRVGCLAGRCLITLTDEATAHQITLITADDEAPFQRLAFGNKGMGPMGQQSIEATEETALRLLRLATVTELALAPASLAIA